MCVVFKMPRVTVSVSDELLNKFREQFPEAILILLVEHGKLSDENKKYSSLWSLDQIQLNSIEQFNIMMIKTNNLKDTVNFINQVVLYTYSGNTIIKRIRGFKRKKTLYDRKLFTLQGFPTIGEKSAHKIIQNYDNIMHFFIKQKENSKIYDILYK